MKRSIISSISLILCMLCVCYSLKPSQYRSQNLFYSNGLSRTSSFDFVSSKYVRLGNRSPSPLTMSSAAVDTPVQEKKSTLKRIVSTISKPFLSVRNKYQRAMKKLDQNAPMLKYLWPKDSPKLKLYLLLSVVSLFIGKWFTLQVPFAFQRAIDLMSSTATSTSTNPIATAFNVNGIFDKFGLNQLGLTATIAVISYGFSRGLATAFAELKTCLFTNVSQNVCRKFALEIFEKMHSLGSEFHVNNPSGTLSVGYVRAVRGFQNLLFEIVFSVAPMLIELSMGSVILSRKFGPKYSAVVVATFALYIFYTVAVTQWKINIRTKVVEVDGKRNSYFIDSILNHEVVKLFNRRPDEAKRYDEYLSQAENLYILTTYAVAVLNLGQAAIFGAGLVSILLMGASNVRAGLMTVGELVAINAMMMQLSLPFNWMGYTYQEIREALVDMSYIKQVIKVGTEPAKMENDIDTGLNFDDIAPRSGPSVVEFKDVKFRYSNNLERVQLIANLTFTVEPGQSVAIVGPSGSGKSTVLKLITRLLETDSGGVFIDGVDNKQVSLTSLRDRIAVIPQDTSLFDNTLEYNIKFGNQNATQEQVDSVIDRCKLRDVVSKLPQGIQTPLGERGARLSGGERQKVAIARALLRDPGVILCDEITSAVDAFAEKEIVNTIREACGVERSSRGVTVITVAHRLSSIMHCDKIIVMNKGTLVEEGSHLELINRPGSVYGQMWRSQRGEETSSQSNILDIDSKNGMTIL